MLPAGRRRENAAPIAFVTQQEASFLLLGGGAGKRGRLASGGVMHPIPMLNQKLFENVKSTCRRTHSECNRRNSLTTPPTQNFAGHTAPAYTPSPYPLAAAAICTRHDPMTHFVLRSEKEIYNKEPNKSQLNKENLSSFGEKDETEPKDPKQTNPTFIDYR